MLNDVAFAGLLRATVIGMNYGKVTAFYSYGVFGVLFNELLCT